VTLAVCQFALRYSQIGRQDCRSGGDGKFSTSNPSIVANQQLKWNSCNEYNFLTLAIV
jgi:hypothetical protein